MDNIEKLSDLPRPQMTAFCVAIVKNASIDMLRQLQKSVHIDYWDNISDEDTDDIEDECIHDADVHRLTVIIDQLEPDERHFIYLRYTLEMGYREIGELLNISEDAAKNVGSGSSRSSKNCMRKGDDMDMNWQTMLHEAANASFEKDIEVRSAADNDAYSCVDLPKAKIRELSEKILHLPHQGIVLLFSRYCFRLSPQETEKFQMKNAKGRFHFYRELLSLSMGLSSEQVISEDSLNQACKIAMKDYLRMELKKDPDVNNVGKNRTSIAFKRFSKAVAVATITITLLFSTAMVVNAQFREKVIAWVVETFEKYSSFEVQRDGENTQADLQDYHLPIFLMDRN